MQEMTKVKPTICALNESSLGQSLIIIRNNVLLIFLNMDLHLCFKKIWNMWIDSLSLGLNSLTVKMSTFLDKMVQFREQD